MDKEILEEYANMKLDVYKAKQTILYLELQVQHLEDTTVPVEEVKKLFKEPYGTNIWVDEKYSSKLVKWYKSTGPWPTYISEEEKEDA